MHPQVFQHSVYVQLHLNICANTDYFESILDLKLFENSGVVKTYLTSFARSLKKS